jgi:hypothetical protein
MEFAIFLNGYIPGPAAHDTEMQHLSYMREAQYAIFADKHNWKYCWFGEHHGLVEYSQLSAPEVMIGYVAEQIAAWGDVGMDQLAFGLPIEGLHHEEILACLELFGDKVIPEFDRDRTHSTDSFRATSEPKFGMLSGVLPNFDMPSVLPESALKQLV